MLRAAVAAPSGHNAQPWRFRVTAGAITVRPDFGRSLPVVDPDDHALFIGLGCAVENLVLAARARGYAPEVDDGGLEARDPRIEVRLERGVGRSRSPLARAIPERQSNRRRYDGRVIPTEDLRCLDEAAKCGAVSFRILDGTKATEPITELAAEGSRLQFEDAAFVAELVRWIRFNGKEAEALGDGLTHRAMGFPPIPRWLGRVVMKRLVTPGSQASAAVRAIRSSPAMMLFAAERRDRRGWVALGRAFERTALTATLLGISHAHMNMPCEVPRLRRQLGDHLDLGSAEPLLLLRIGYAKPVPRSPRRPLAEVVAEEPASPGAPQPWSA